MRRFVTESVRRRQGQTLQTVIIHPAAINQRQVKKGVGWYAIKGLVVNEKNRWRYEELNK